MRKRFLNYGGWLKIRARIKKNDGFSLIELISVILILGIVAGVVAPEVVGLLCMVKNVQS